MSMPEIQHPQEDLRLKDLRNLQILDTPLEERFERLTRLVQRTFDVPICAISCVDQHRQWFKSIQGLDISETARCVSFCQHTVLQHDALVINDARIDERFKDSPLVTQDPKIVFYAGTQIYSKNRIPIASLCLIDTKPKTMNPDEIEMLCDFARMVESEIHSAAPNGVHHQLVNAIGHSWRITLIDPLTRLWNSEGIATLVDGHLASDIATSHGLSVAFIDLRKFHEINTKLGHVAGDEMLRNFGKYLLKNIDREHIVGRINNNTFAVLLNGVAEESDLNLKLRSLQSLVDSYPIKDLDGRETLGGHIAAVVVKPGWDASVSSLFDQLDETMHRVKQANIGQQSRQPMVVNATQHQTSAA